MDKNPFLLGRGHFENVALSLSGSVQGQHEVGQHEVGDEN